MGSRVIQTAWDRARAQAVRTDLRLHDLRHSGLTWSAATGASTAELLRRAAMPPPQPHSATSTPPRTVTVLADALADLASDAPIVRLERATNADKLHRRVADRAKNSL